MADPQSRPSAVDTSPDVLAQFSTPVREWFRTTFATPTAAQAQGWPAIASGDHTLILAPTGSGKTLTAFLWAIDRLITQPPAERDRRLRVLYVSPLRALAVDVDRNLRAPLEGIRLTAERLGVEVHRPDVAVRTGDTPQDERQRLMRRPPDILITTPESLFLMLTSSTREALTGIETVILERRSREYVEGRIRAGVLEQGTMFFARDVDNGIVGTDPIEEIFWEVQLRQVFTEELCTWHMLPGEFDLCR